MYIMLVSRFAPRTKECVIWVEFLILISLLFLENSGQLWRNSTPVLPSAFNQPINVSVVDANAVGE
jgi:hypothetical protein